MFIRYCLARYEEKQTGEACRIYVTEALRAIAGNTSAMVGGGVKIDMSFENFIHPKKKDTRTGEEIAADVIKKAGLKVVKTDGTV